MFLNIYAYRVCELATFCHFAQPFALLMLSDSFLQINTFIKLHSSIRNCIQERKDFFYIDMLFGLICGLYPWEYLGNLELQKGFNAVNLRRIPWQRIPCKIVQINAQVRQ